MENETVPTEPLNTEEGHEKSAGKSKFSVKYAVIIAVILIIGSLGYAYKGLFIAATVDGSPITRLTVVSELEKASGKALLDSLINEKLIENDAKANKIVVTNDEINNEIKPIEAQIIAQGNTLDKALAAQGMSMDDFRHRIVLQKDVEKLLADKIAVTDAEVAQYIKDNKTSIPKGQEAVTLSQIKNQLVSQKLKSETQNLLAELRSKASIKYYVNY